MFMTYSIREESSSLDPSRLDSLEEVHHTCLQSLQLRGRQMSVPVRPTPSLSGERGMLANTKKLGETVLD